MAEINRVPNSDSSELAGDMVFVHGLDGDAVETWQVHGKPDTFWPLWLANDIPSLAVWTISYNASSTAWRGTALALGERAVNVLAVLESKQLGGRPLLFVTHSLGGLVIKQALRRATELGSPASWLRIAKATRGVVFLATPHGGSAIASAVRTAARFIPLLRPTSLIDDLKADSPQLRDLNSWYRAAAPRLGIRTQVYYERQPVGLGLVVSDTSSDPGLCDAVPIPMDSNHISICKPTSRDAMLYSRIRAFVSDIIDASPFFSSEAIPATASDAPRIITVFLSCSNELAGEREELENVIRRIAVAFAPHGVHLVSWRYDRDAIPGLGSDAQAVINTQLPAYDIYVGLMCRRFGTPTGRWPSGTVEEFEQARARWARDGQPHVLFYFCRTAPAGVTAQEAEQANRVEDFRRRFPGMFVTFDGISDLTAKFERHLLKVVLEIILPQKMPALPTEQETPETSSRGLEERAWVTRATATIDAENQSSGLLDYSGARPGRIISKLEHLFGCNQRLSSFERDVLLAAEYLRTAGAHGSQTAVEGVAHQMGAELIAASWNVALAAGAAPGLYADEVHGLTGPKIAAGPGVGYASAVRTSLLVALIRLGELMDLDVQGLSQRGGRSAPGIAPAVGEVEVVCWAAILTREIAVRPGVATFLLSSPVEEWTTSIKHCTALRLEAEWQRSRGVLAGHGFSMTVAPAEVLIIPEMEPPRAEVLEAFITAARQVVAHFKSLPHLGELKIPHLSDLLPLPESMSLGALVVPLPPDDYEYFVEITTVGQKAVKDSKSRMTRFRPTAERTSVVIGAEFLSAENGYVWTIYRDDGDGEIVALATGVVRPLSAGLAIASTIGEQLGSTLPSSTRLAALSLWNDWLIDVWSDLFEGGVVDPSTLGTAFNLFSAAYELNRKAGRIGLVRTDAYRNAANWVSDRLLKQTGATP